MMRFINFKFIGSLFFFAQIVLSPTVIHASEVMSAEDPELILEIAKGFGSAKLKKDSEGDPMISGRIDGNKYVLSFYGCNDSGQKCNDVKFGSAWGGIEVSMGKINSWNKSKRYGVAYLDSDNDPNIDMAANLDYGVTVENFEDTFGIWTIVVKSFKEEILNQ